MKKRATYKVDVNAPILKKLDFSSTVILEVLVGTSGEVICTKTISGIPFAQQPVEKAVQSWRFGPERLKGKPVPYLGQLDFLLCNGVCARSGFGVSILK